MSARRREELRGIKMRQALLTVFLLSGSLSIQAEGPSASVPGPGRPVDISNMDASVQPCVDFYQYADGGWLVKNPVPADRARWGGFEELAERNRMVLKAIALETSARTDWPKGSVRQKVSDFFAAGMDTEAIEKAGLAPLAPWTRKIESLKDAEALPALLAELHRYQMPAGFGFFVAQDQRNSTRYIPSMGQGGLGMPDRDYYIKDNPKSKELRGKYVGHVSRMFQLAGDDARTADRKAGVVMVLETRLAKASRTRVELRDPVRNYNRKVARDLAREAPGFEWKAYLAAMSVPPEQELNVRQPEFFREFAAMTSSVPVEDWRTYLTWHLLRSTARLLPKRFEEESFEFTEKTLNGVPLQEERWKRVLAATDSALGEGLGQLYVEKNFSLASKERVKALVENLRAALRERIVNLDWMGPETKKAALRKLAAFGVKIGYPDRWRDYSSLQISRASYFENVVAARAFESRRNLAKLGKEIDRTEWGMSPPTVNAYYSPTMNEIVFPAGILQPPFFWADGDDGVNYGGIGSVIGHEMTHGFDDSGSQYDAEGNLRNWWRGEDRKAYEARTVQVVKQFDSYRALPDQSINGKLTLGENIADLGALKISYAALGKALGMDPVAAPKIESFTPAQRFFLSWAGVWRNNIRDEALRVRLNTDPHSPGKWRVLGPVSSLPEFASAFGCEASQPMVRPSAERPAIW